MVDGEVGRAVEAHVVSRVQQPAKFQWSIQSPVCSSSVWPVQEVQSRKSSPEDPSPGGPVQEVQSRRSKSRKIQSSMLLSRRSSPVCSSPEWLR